MWCHRVRASLCHTAWQLHAGGQPPALHPCAAGLTLIHMCHLLAARRPPAGLIHSRVNPTCGDLELLILFNSATPVLEKAVPALLQMPPSRGQCGRRVGCMATCPFERAPH